MPKKTGQRMKMSLSSSFERLPIQLSPLATVMSTRWRFSCIMRSICSSKVSLVMKLTELGYLDGHLVGRPPAALHLGVDFATFYFYLYDGPFAGVCGTARYAVLVVDMCQCFEPFVAPPGVSKFLSCHASVVFF